MIIAVIIFAIVLLHVIVGLGWILYKVFKKPKSGNAVLTEDTTQKE